MRILCLEQGDWVKPTDYPSNGRDWEARLFTDFAISPNRRARETDYPINDANSPIKVVNFNGVGGSTIMYTAHYPRLQPSDFKVRSLDGVADDWPVDYDTLEPFFAENDRMMGVSGLAGDPAYPFHQPPMPPLPLGKTGQRIGTAMNKLGWHWWPSDSTIATVDYEGRGALHQSRPLHAGLRAGRQGQHRHHLLAGGDPRRRRAAHALPGARDHARRARHGVRRDLLRRQGRGAVPAGRAGDRRLQRRRHAAPAAELAVRPLPQRAGQLDGLVGRNLMFHPYAYTYGYVDEQMDGNHGPTLCLWSQEFYETDTARDFVRGYTFQINRGTASIIEAISSTAAGRLPWGEDHHAVYRRLLNHRIGLSAICEDLPEAHNRVTLDPVLKDSNGIPAPRIDYTLEREQPQDDGARASPGRRRCSRPPARRTSRTEAPILNGGWHLLGTARMGNDPERSVVNGWGRSHDVKNLFIVDGSIWVTSGGVNPTSTIQALALCIADNIKRRAADGTCSIDAMALTTASWRPARSSLRSG